jgi:putative tryptophan/tyrosine transport system substrate-binding protein
VFVLVADPVGAEFVASLARPGGNATGFSFSEYGIGAKWLELVKEVNAGRDTSGGSPGFRPSRRERGIADFARPAKGGLIVTAGGPVIVHRQLIISLAAKHQLPAVYFNPTYPAASGLMSYGPDTVDQYRQAAR